MRKLLPAVIPDNTYTVNLKLRSDSDNGIINLYEKINFLLFYYITRIDPKFKVPYTRESEERMDAILKQY